MLKKKNILYIVHNYNNFQKDYVESTAKFFDKVYVLVRYKPISRVVKYLPFKSLKHYDDSYVIDLRNLPPNVTVIKTPVWYLPWGGMYQIAGLLHFLSVEQVIRKYKLKFDIIHSHFLWTAGYVGKKLKEKYHVPFIVTGHGYDVYELPFENPSWKQLIQNVLFEADEVITVSEHNRKCLLDLELDKNKIHLLYNSYNNNLFKIVDKNIYRSELGLSQNEKVCLCVGNLESVKGHQYLIEAMQILLKSNSDLKCYIIGGGSLTNSLNSLIKQLGLERNVKIFEALPHPEIVKWMGACDVFVLPSLKESGPIVVLEALACGRPVVSTNVGIVSCVIKNSNCGFIVEPGDIKGLAEGIMMSLETSWNPSVVQECVKPFSLNKRAEKEEILYKKLLKIK